MCATLLWLVFVASIAVTAVTCPPGTFFWMQEGIPRCAQCLPGCACPGNYSGCQGCAGGFFSAQRGASACAPCPVGTTTEYIFNAGCDPQDYQDPCANQYGPLGWAQCHPVPPPPRVAYAMPTGAAPIPPVDDIDGVPMLQQSY